MPPGTGNEGGKLLIKRIAGVVEKVIDIFYPKRCAFCDRVLPVGEKFLCSECSGLTPEVGEHYCMKCGKPVEEDEEYCIDCTNKETTFQYGRSVFVYNGLVKDSISRFKYHGRQEYAAFYAHAMYRQFGTWIARIAPDALIPVPIHKERRQRRGYNQAELVALELGRLCKVPVAADYLVRIKNTQPQKELSGKERLANLSQAFSVRTMSQELYKNLECVIIVDDIYTTGSTVETCAQILREQGVGRIYFLCIGIGKGL